jgi:hypothetical protein
VSEPATDECAGAKGRLSNSDLAQLFGALIGVAIGAALALVLACVIFPPLGAYESGRAGTLDWAKGWARQEDREKGFYALTLLLGGTFGYLGAWLRIGGNRPTIVAAVLLAGSVPAMTMVIARAMAGSPLESTAYGMAAAIILTLLALLMRNVTGIDEAIENNSKPALPATNHEIEASRWARALILFAGFALIAALVVPLSVRSIAAPIGKDIHMAGNMIGPATFAFGMGLIPGIDYFTQYSVGTPWIFSFFLAPTAGDTLMNAIRFVVGEIVFFQITLFCFLWWFLRSWAWAIFLTVAILMVQFTTATPLHAPSSTSARYVLLMVIVGVFAWWIKRDFSPSITVLLALSLTGALFLGTETGVYACVAAAITTMLVMPGHVRCLRMIVLLAVLTFFFFMLLGLIAFGRGVLDYRYLWGLVEPLLLYASGLGAYPIEWFGGLHWFYNIISPGVALATIGWVAVVTRQPHPPFARQHLAALAMISLFGLFLSAKFINMSIVALWQVNSIGFLIVLAWWARGLIDWLGDLPLFRMRYGIRVAATGALWMLLAVFVCVIEDPRNPSLYAVQSYRTHPSLVNVLLAGTRHDCPEERLECGLQLTTPDDVALIARLSQPGERVALLFLQDWPLLIETRRASQFHFVPSVDVFTERQLQGSLRDINLIFLPRRPANVLGVTHAEMAAILVPMLKEKFTVVDESSSLLAWRRVR